MNSDFVHLHSHTEYSLLDGANRISDLVKAASADGQRALALTDHGNLFGAIELYKAAKASEQEVKPLIGCEGYLARDSMLKPHSKKQGNGYNHLTLIARNDEGYQNLIQLASSAYTEGYHFRPRIDKELLAEHATGLIGLSSCLKGEVATGLRTEQPGKARDAAATFRDILGPGNFFLEMQYQGIEEQRTVNRGLPPIANELGLPLV